MGDAPTKGFWARTAEDFGKARQFLRDRRQVRELGGKKNALQEELDVLLRTLGQRAHAAGAGSDLPAFKDVDQAQSAAQSAQAQQSQRSAAVAQAKCALQAEQAAFEPILQQKREAHDQSAVQAKKADTELQTARKAVAAAEDDLNRTRNELQTAQSDADKPLPDEPGPPPPETAGEELLQVEQPEAQPQAGPEADPAQAERRQAADAARRRRDEHQAKVRAYEEALARRQMGIEDVQRLQAALREQEQALEQARLSVLPLEQAEQQTSAQEQKDAAALAATEQEWNQKKSQLEGNLRDAADEEKAATAAASAATDRLAQVFLAFGLEVLQAAPPHPDLSEPMAQARAHNDQVGQVDEQIAVLHAEMETLRGPFVKASFYTVVFALLVTIAVIGIAWLVRAVF